MATSSSRRKVGVGSLVGLLAVLFFGLVLFQRMWTFHSALSLAQGNAAHLEKLYDEALDEAADWRNKYDADVKKVTQELEEKVKLLKSLEGKTESLQKENQALEEKMAVLKGELLEEKQKCETATKANGAAAN
eukprot:c29312_g1_i1 orf=239-637(+)